QRQEDPARVRPETQPEGGARIVDVGEPKEISQYLDWMVEDEGLLGRDLGELVERDDARDQRTVQHCLSSAPPRCRLSGDDLFGRLRAPGGTHAAPPRTARLSATIAAMP